ncbi:HAD family hydrolase [Yinghuangia soli]|uniref:HAD family hydrolase n=1 Tax=Yinghuangia soli TaxID=2908204 RepID=A0AA41PX67_9ACTN|nr:HAD family hydrolase [Yinghuangia soli]MCF2527000.1 HAD family hydrolase [Yinghuangia soli]
MNPNPRPVPHDPEGAAERSRAPGRATPDQAALDQAAPDQAALDQATLRPTASCPAAPNRADLGSTLVLFDWNGTIADDVERAVRATNAVLTARGLPELTAEAFRARWKLPMRAFLTGLDVADPAAGEQHWNRAMASEPAPVRGNAAATLDTLRSRGALLGVISAAGSDAVGADLRRTGLADRFDIVLAGCAAKTAALSGHRHLRDRAVYVGDTEYDIHCARAARYHAVGITGGYREPGDLRSSRPDALIDRLDELVPLLAVLPRGLAAAPEGTRA